jgi:hypothetical protein
MVQEVSQPGMLKNVFREMMKGVYTCTPGHIVTFDPATQLAQVQIGIVRVDIDGAEFNPPPIIEVPVCFMGNAWTVEYQIDTGCEGLIFFSQRCIDGWIQTGGIAANPLGRFHDMQDAFILPGFRSIPNAISDFQNNGIRIRNASGNQFAWLKNDGSIAVENGAGHIRMAADGVVTINGVTFDTQSNVTTPTKIKSKDNEATNSLVIANKEMKNHIHLPGTYQAGGVPVTNNSGVTV